MAEKQHKYNETKNKDQMPDEKGIPVPGTGHDTKKLKQKG